MARECRETVGIVTGENVALPDIAAKRQTNLNEKLVVMQENGEVFWEGPPPFKGQNLHGYLTTGRNEKQYLGGAH